MDILEIKEAAEKTGISANNLKYYEKLGLIPKIQKDKSGIRNYSERDIRWIRFVIKFKETGAKLEHIIEYMNLAYMDIDTKYERKKILLNIESDLVLQIEHLQECLDVIRRKIENYDELCNPITEDMVKELKTNNK